MVLPPIAGVRNEWYSGFRSQDSEWGSKQENRKHRKTGMDITGLKSCTSCLNGFWNFILTPVS
jgi:hypothetical protein